MSLNARAREAIAKYDMLNSGDMVFIGVSGGADSVCLLHFLCGLKDEFSLDITALHLNHTLRSDESDRDEVFVRSLCSRMNVPLVSESADVKAISRERGISVEEAGREARYDFFSRCGGEKKTGNAPVKIAVAHNLNDSAETALLNFARGTALRGLAGIPPSRNADGFTVIRPLITCSRREIEAYCEKNNLEYVIDSTNLIDCFARNRLRRYVLPRLEGINQSFLNNAAVTLELLRADADFLDRLAEESLSAIRLKENRIDREKYLALPDPVRLRALASELSRFKIQVDHKRVLRLDAMAESGSGTEQLSPVLYFEAGKLDILFRPPRPEPHNTDGECFFREIIIPELYGLTEIEVFSNKKLHVMNTDYEHYEENIKYNAKPLKNALDYDRINGTVKMRQKSSALKIKLEGKPHARTLKNLFQEAKIPPHKRSRTVILEDDEGLIWIEGFGAAQRVAVTNAARRVLILTVEEEM